MNDIRLELSPSTRADQVFSHLRQRIVEGQIMSGAKLSEPELASYYEISRSTLRDALARIEACGLLIRKPNIGYRVVTLSLDKLLEILVVRQALEGMASRLAAQNMSEQAVQKLKEFVQHKCLQQKQSQKAQDLEFHYQIVHGSQNSMLIRLLCDELYHLVAMYHYQFGVPTIASQRTDIEQSNIARAIEDRDGELAEMLMRRHIATAQQNITGMLNKTNYALTQQ